MSPHHLSHLQQIYIGILFVNVMALVFLVRDPRSPQPVWLCEFTKLWSMSRPVVWHLGQLDRCALALP